MQTTVAQFNPALVSTAQMHSIVKKYHDQKTNLNSDTIRILTNAWEPFVRQEIRRESRPELKRWIWEVAGWSYEKADFVGVIQ